MKSTITFKGVEIEVEYDYYPEESMVMYYKDGSGHPGESAHVELKEVKIGDQSIWELLVDDIEDIECQILENIEPENY